MSETLLHFDIQHLSPEHSAPAPEKVLSGAPANLTWNFEDDGKGLFSGIWESTPGEWRVDYTEWEFCHIISGVSILTEDGKPPVHLRAGDAFVIRPGFRGTWRVIETTRKHYVVRT